MNPMYVDDTAPPPRDRWKYLRLAWRIVRACTRVLLKEIRLSRRSDTLRIEDGTTLQPLTRAVMYRLAFVPVIGVIFVAALVFVGTHPPRVVIEPNESTIHTLYYDPVNLISSDGTQLEGMIFPLLDARRVIEHREKVLRERFPAVILVHDYGQTPQQMLPLVRPLHDAGYVVLVVGVRGRGTERQVGQTFGIREAMDVRAAIEMLRRRALINAGQISVVGVGSGASAALLALRDDPLLAAVVLLNPIQSGAEAIKNFIGPAQDWLDFLRPLCKWTFEICYDVDVDEINLSRHEELMKERAVLTIEVRDSNPANTRSADLRAMCTFLDEHVKQLQPVNADLRTPDGR